jgi:outer membrane lipoprotein SlyB
MQFSLDEGGSAASFEHRPGDGIGAAMNLSRTAIVRLPLAVGALLLGACTVMPTGPSVMALPGSRTSVEQFQSDAFACQQYAQTVVSTATGTAVNADNAAANSAAAGAVLGAATGAIIGAATGQAGQGAAIGAGTGLLFGGMSGSYYTSMSSYQLQRGYDGAYLQCMYQRGHQVPASRGYSTASRAPYGPAGEAPSRYPPPNQPPPSKSSIVGPTKPIYAQPPAVQGAGTQPAAPSSGGQSGTYPAPPNVPPGNYPPPDTPPPRN